ncbi:MAG: hypothetical protein EU517_01360, partial [Promethearchaeota archaeon]
MVENEKVITAQEIRELFGLHSSFYKNLSSFLKKEAQNRNKKYQQKYSFWESIFRKFYGGDATHQLFLKQTYFSLVLKLFVLNRIQNKALEGLPFQEFDIYDWVELNPTLIYDFNEILADREFNGEDLFHELYQQVFIMITRHKIGEFYTFPKLANKMVQYFYEYGSKILDPSCGSGTFLVEIVKTIFKTNKPLSSKIKAIEKIYGFDVNPLAVLSTKTNLFLLIMNETSSHI